MGYYMRHKNSLFEIESTNALPALKAIKDLVNHTDSFSWVNTNGLSKAKILKEAFEAWRWGVLGDPITEIYFNGEKIGDDRILFDTIAPFVKPGSYIEMSGEDGLIWRWCFDGNKCSEDTAELDWDGNTEMIDAIMEQKRILPTLMGIHPRLDAKIAEVLKK